MNASVFFVLAGLCVTQALEGYSTIFSVVDQATKTLASIATDEQSNIAILGSFTGEIVLGEKHLQSDDQDLFIARLNANHSILWSYQIGGHQPDDPGVVNFDRQNNIVFGGKFASRTITFQNTTVQAANNDPSSYYFDLLLGKMSPNGSLLWMKNFGDVNSTSQHLSDMVILSDNSIVICGVYYNTGYFGGDQFVARSHEKARYAQSDFFVAKYTADGDHLWSYGLGGDHEEIANGLALDKDDNIYVAATFQSDDIILGGKQVEQEPRGRDCLLMKCTPDGTYAWHKQFGSRSTDYLRSVAIDSQGNIILVAQVSGNVTIDNTTVHAEGYHHLFLLKLSGNGDYIWGKMFTADFVTPKRLLINFRTDQIILIGNYNAENFTLGLDYLPHTPSDCLFIGQWSQDGQPIASKGLCGNNTIHAESGALDATGAILVGCDLYDIGVIGEVVEEESMKSAIAIFKQIPETQESQETQELSHADVHDEL